MNDELIALMTEFQLSSKSVAVLFGVKVRTVDSWRSSPDSPNYRSMDKARGRHDKDMYKLRMKRIRRYLTQIRDT